MNYYTYAYLREEDGTPYYIGKGQGPRIHRDHGWLHLPPDKKNRIFLKTGLTAEEALRHESYLISVLGRKDKGEGRLLNKTDGGDGPQGVIISKETREKLREKRRGRKPALGMKHTVEAKEKMRERMLENNPFRGKIHTEESKRKMSENSKGRTPWNKGRKMSEETKRKISEVKKGRAPWNKGAKEKR
jgi:hypothetical protein